MKSIVILNFKVQKSCALIRSPMFSAKFVLIIYGIFLIDMGLIGYLTNPERAQTALISGGLFGILSIFLGILWGRNFSASRPLSFGILSLLFIVFSWRATVSWLAYNGGNDEKFWPAIIITAMLLATFFTLVILRKASPPVKKQ